MLNKIMNFFLFFIFLLLLTHFNAPQIFAVVPSEVYSVQIDSIKQANGCIQLIESNTVLKIINKCSQPLALFSLDQSENERYRFAIPIHSNAEPNSILYPITFSDNRKSQKIDTNRYIGYWTIIMKPEKWKAGEEVIAKGKVFYTDPNDSPVSSIAKVLFLQLPILLLCASTITWIIMKFKKKKSVIINILITGLGLYSLFSIFLYYFASRLF